MSAAFTACLRHSVVPTQFLESYVVPVIKDKHGDASDPGNYRGIAVLSIISKVLELMCGFFARYADVSSQQQFGFKKGHGCSDYSFVLKETVDYYLLNSNKKVYVCALDLSKHMIKFPFIVCLTSYWIEGLLYIWLNFLPSGNHVKK